MQLSAIAQAPRPVIQWDRAYGGIAEDRFSKVRATPDGGCLMVGSSKSGISSEKSQPCQGGYDWWVVKLDAAGQKQWDRTFGGPQDDQLSDARITPDGGYLLAGNSSSGAGSDKSEPNRGKSDMWVIKIDGLGNKQWDRTFGGTEHEGAADIWLTRDGGCVLAGTTYSGQSGDKSQPSRGFSDWWVIKLDATGNKQWDRDFGGAGEEYCNSVQQTADGGYIVGGSSYSDISPDKSQNVQGQNDYWIIKLDGNGIRQWDRSYGAPLSDNLDCVRQTSDGGFLLAGSSMPGAGGDKTQAGFGSYDYWIVKTDATGRMQWDKTTGGLRDDYVRDLLLTDDGGCLLAGESYLYPGTSGQGGTKTQPNFGVWDMWVVKLNAAGAQEWDRDYGGTVSEYTGGIDKAADGGYLLGCWSNSPASGNKSAASRGDYDFWLVKLGVGQITGESKLCAGSTVQLTAPAGGAPYHWNTGATTASITVAQVGLYTVIYTDSDGSPASLQQQVTNFTPPPVKITGDSLICSGTTSSLLAVAAGATGYRWNNGATTPTLSVNQPGTYSVQAFFGANCSTTTQFRLIQLNPPKPFSLGIDTTLCEGQELILRAPSPIIAGNLYRWSDGSTAATLRISTAGIYNLQITGCGGAQSSSRSVAVHSCVQIGNIITPNHDGQNDRFEVRNLPAGNWSFSVFSRWGYQEYSTEAYHNEWGEMAVAGIYYYILRQPTTGTIYKGWVEVLR